MKLIEDINSLLEDIKRRKESYVDVSNIGVEFDRGERKSVSKLELKYNNTSITFKNGKLKVRKRYFLLQEELENYQKIITQRYINDKVKENLILLKNIEIDLENVRKKVEAIEKINECAKFIVSMGWCRTHGKIVEISENIEFKIFYNTLKEWLNDSTRI